MRPWSSMAVLCLLLAPAPLPAQEQAQEQGGDRHTARREWLARRRAGTLGVDSPAAKAGSKPGTASGRGAEARSPTLAEEASQPHRFAGRYPPNYEARLDDGLLWPVEPLGFGRGGFRGRGGGYGTALPYAPWADTPWPWWQSQVNSCARITLAFEFSAPVTLYLMLPPAAPFDEAELELLLERELARGQQLVLQDGYGEWVRVRAGARLERVAVSGCNGRSTAGWNPIR